MHDYIADLVKPSEDIKKIHDLIEYLIKRGFKGKIEYLVFTGDAIDYDSIDRLINEELPDAPTDVKQNRQNELMVKAFSIAQTVLEQIRDKLGIDKQKVFIVCGNHDMFRHEVSSITNRCECSSENNNETKMAGDFKLFNDFVKNVNGENDAYYTKAYNSGRFNFICVNTNFISKGKIDNNKERRNHRKNNCINCYNVEKEISTNRTKFSGYLNQINILLSHAIPTEFCKLATDKHAENNENPIWDKINSMINLHLCGDDHADKQDKSPVPKWYCVGAQLWSSSITYELFQFNDDNADFLRHKLVYKDKLWRIEVSEKMIAEIEEIYKISADSIKKRVLTVFGLNEMSTADISRHIANKTLQKEKWEHVHNLFHKNIVELKEPCSKQTITLGQNELLLDKITQLIKDAKDNEKSPIIFQGEPKLGKSMFLSFYYFYLLDNFVNNNGNLLPIYINVEENNKFYAAAKPLTYSEVKGVFSEILSTVSSLITHNVNAQVIIIIDGLDRYKYCNDNDLSNNVFDVITSLEYEKSKIKFLYSLHDEKNLSFGLSNYGKTDIRPKAEKLAYFTAIDISKDYDTDSDNFLNAYRDLFGDTFKNLDFINFLKGLRWPPIELDMITHYADDEYIKFKPAALSDIYAPHFKNVFKHLKKRDHLYKAAYLFSYRKPSKTFLTFEDLQSDTGISYKDFIGLKQEKNIRSYCIANYYVQNLQEYATPKGNVEQLSVLDIICIKKDSAFIVNLIKSGRCYSEFLEYFKKIINCDNYNAIAVVSYE